ncbi:receptor-type tyrosine-protein kinase FLT3 isoform X2 [Ambystoma mexicanum]|uniref:receptor-type tyrosine-protein kinase FLT3 isoform X2 n=1 Tax=Ambystoma mexicanum TaxID=8296 RepID=UPI0037E87EAE
MRACCGLVWVQAAVLAMALNVDENTNKSSIRCIARYQRYLHSRPWQSTGTPEISKSWSRTEDLGCHLMFQNSTETHSSAGMLELQEFDFAIIQVMMNITGDISCSWYFDERVSECSPHYDAEGNVFVSKDFFKMAHSQAGEYKLIITFDNQNYTISFPIRVKSKPSKPYFTGYSRKVNCTSESYPKPTVAWLVCPNPSDSCTEKTGKDYLTNGHARGIQKVEHEIESKMLFDKVIWCCATNELGRECTKLPTTDLSGSSGSFVLDVFLKVGEPLLLRCRAVHNSYKFNLNWEFNSTSLSYGAVFEEHKKEGTSTIKVSFAQVPSVGRSNSGNYTCIMDYDSIGQAASGNDSYIVDSHSRRQAAKLTLLDTGFIDASTSSEEHEIDLNEVFCFEVRLKVYPNIHCMWSSKRKNFPCELSYSDEAYSLSSKFCNHSYQSGEYIFDAENEDARVQKRFTLYVKPRPEVRMIKQEGKETLLCVSEGYPASTWFWKKCAEGMSNCTDVIRDGIKSDTPERSFESWKSISTLDLTKVMGSVSIRCCANTSAGVFCAHEIFNHPGYPSSSDVPHQIIYYATIGVCVLCTTLLIAFISHKCKKGHRYESQLQMIQFVGPSDNEYIYIDFSLFEYDVKWEFPRENLEFGKVLGSGAFGKVVEASAYGITKPGVSLQVAVKMLKDRPEAAEKDALMSELKMMTHIGNHTNIVNLLGACTVSGPVYLIFEYCCNGDLLNYLKGNRETFLRTWAEIFQQHNFSFNHNFKLNPATRTTMKNGSYMAMTGTVEDIKEQIKPDFDSGIDESMNYSEEEALAYENRRGNEEDELNVLTFEDLLCFSYQVAKGMEFLGSKQCIHRDLAARNILVTHGKVVKICDFGLARDIMNDSNYVVKGNARLPVKWMAPESLFEGIYTIKSDVWSYGILLWEIFSIGVNPYPGMQVDGNFYKLLRNGFKMDQPYYATEEIYIVMQSCWSYASNKRPSFSQLVSFLGCQLSAFEEVAFQNMDNKSSQYKNIQTSQKF